MRSILKAMFATTMNIYTFARPEELGMIMGRLFGSDKPRAAAATGSVWRDCMGIKH